MNELNRQIDNELKREKEAQMYKIEKTKNTISYYGIHETFNKIFLFIYLFLVLLITYQLYFTTLFPNYKIKIMVGFLLWTYPLWSLYFVKWKLFIWKILKSSFFT